MCSAVGSFGYAGRFTLYVVLTNRDANPATNQSVVDYNVYFQNTSGGGTFTSNTRLYFALNGGVIKDSTSSITGPRNGSVSIASGSTTIGHNNDGTKTISYHALVKSTSFGIYGELSGNFTLTTIPRASSITCSTANIGSKPTIKITSASTSFVHNVYGSFGSLSFTALSNKSGGTYTEWTIPTDFYSQIPNATSGTGTMHCQTYSGSTLVGTTSISFTVTTSESACKPTVTGTVVDTNSTTIALTGNANKLISGKSTAKITVTPSAKNSASIKTVTIDGVATTNNTRTISNVTKASFPVVVTDSRGYTNASYSATASGGIVNYIQLTINANFFRPQPTTGEVKLTYSGNYFNASFGSVSNTLSISWKYRTKGASSWTNGGTITPTLNGNTITSKTISLGTSFDYRTAYEFQFVASDKLTSITQTYQVAMGMPVFYWGKDYLHVDGNLNINSTIQGGNVPIGYTFENVSFNDVAKGKMLNKNFLGTIHDGSNWYHLINVRHRNGNSDGVNYGMQIRNLLNASHPELRTRLQANGNWGNWFGVHCWVSLFENTSGVMGTVTLSQSAANFKFLEIYYQSTSDSGTGYAQASTRVFNPNGKSAWLSTGYCGSSDYNVKICSVLISGNQITRPYGYWEFKNGTHSTTNYIGITKVIGYN